VLPRLAYLTLCRSVQLLVLLARGDAAKELEITVLRRQTPRPRLEPADRALLAAASRVLPRACWSCLFVKPETLLRWHRRLIASAWTCQACRSSRWTAALQHGDDATARSRYLFSNRSACTPPGGGPGGRPHAPGPAVAGRSGGAGRSTRRRPAPMPAQQRLGLDEEARPTGSGQHAADRGEQGSVGGLELGMLDLAVEHGELVAQDEDLQVLGGVPAGEQGEQLDGAAQREVGEVRQHQVSSAVGAEAHHTDPRVPRNPSSQLMSEFAHPSGFQVRCALPTPDQA
jgi:hypothetical protein